MKQLRYLWRRFNRLRCPKCGGEEVVSATKETVANVVCECEETCRDCGTFRNYWAYGFYQYPETKTELICWHLRSWKASIQNKFR